jgi:uroporphyrinogen-III synthase
MIPILLTRPAAQAQEFAAQITARFGPAAQCVISPVLEMVTLSPEIDFTAYAGLVFTSQNGVAAYRQIGGPSGLPAYCVGDKTTRAAQEAGLDARSAGGDITALNALLAQMPDLGPLLHPSGVHVAGQVTGEVTRVAVYDQRPLDLTAQARDILRQPGAVLAPLFSPRSAHVLQEALPADRRAKIHAICLSQAVRDALDADLFGHISIAKGPMAEAMLDKMAEFFPS